MQSLPSGAEGIDASLDIWIIDERRGMKTFLPGVDHQTAAAPPVLNMAKRLDPFNVTGWSRASEDHPQQVLQTACAKHRIINDDDQGEVIDLVVLIVGTAESDQVSRRHASLALPGLALQDKHAGQTNLRSAEPGRKTQLTRNLGGQTA